VKPALTALLLAWLAGTAAPAAAAEPCPAAPTTGQLRLTVDYGKIVHDLTRSGAELGRLDRGGGDKAAAQGEETMGLTVAEFAIDGHADIKTRKIAQGVCVYPKSIVLRLGYPLFRVYIDRRFLPGTCRYRSLIVHEHTHVQIARAALQRHAGAMRRALQLYLEAHPSLLVAKRSAARGVYMTRLQRVLDPLVAALDADSGRGQARLDEPASLERTWRACPEAGEAKLRG
jgi:hypothetical protein